MLLSFWLVQSNWQSMLLNFYFWFRYVSTAFASADSEVELWCFNFQCISVMDASLYRLSANQPRARCKTRKRIRCWRSCLRSVRPPLGSFSSNLSLESQVNINCKSFVYSKEEQGISDWYVEHAWAFHTTLVTKSVSQIYASWCAAFGIAQSNFPLSSIIVAGCTLAHDCKCMAGGVQHYSINVHDLSSSKSRWLSREFRSRARYNHPIVFINSWSGGLVL